MARILIGNIKGPKGDVGPQGKQGPVGPVGPQGPLPPLINNGLTTEAGKAALDAAYGKTMADKLAELNSDIAYHAPEVGHASLDSLDINGHKRNSIIALGSADVSKVQNLPVQQNGILRTISAGAYCIQEYFTAAKMQSRFFNGSTWANWQ